MYQLVGLEIGRNMPLPKMTMVDWKPKDKLGPNEVVEVRIEGQPLQAVLLGGIPTSGWRGAETLLTVPSHTVREPHSPTNRANEIALSITNLTALKLRHERDKQYARDNFLTASRIDVALGILKPEALAGVSPDNLWQLVFRGHERIFGSLDRRSGYFVSPPRDIALIMAAINSLPRDMLRQNLNTDPWGDPTTYNEPNRFFRSFGKSKGLVDPALMRDIHDTGIFYSLNSSLYNLDSMGQSNSEHGYSAGVNEMVGHVDTARYLAIAFPEFRDSMYINRKFPEVLNMLIERSARGLLVKENEAPDQRFSTNDEAHLSLAASTRLLYRGEKHSAMLDKVVLKRIYKLRNALFTRVRLAGISQDVVRLGEIEADLAILQAEAVEWQEDHASPHLLRMREDPFQRWAKLIDMNGRPLVIEN